MILARAPIVQMMPHCSTHTQFQILTRSSRIRNRPFWWNHTRRELLKFSKLSSKSGKATSMTHL